ncbi:PilZ domain-containing protein [Novosphingobium sp.]|uniref:PilZ domain-containing protein n=1 Tax=Novosphingobium sp. TaxID=1874826 RepID=UPI0025CD0C21|nr:PilZ domain-containing protein [Novosphingobium sp.]
MSDREDGRHQHRLAVSIPTKCIGKVDKLPATIDDLSCNGCRIGNHVRKLTVGSRLTLKFEGLEPIAGWIKWSDRDHAGMEFETPLHPFVFERLSRMHAAP